MNAALGLIKLLGGLGLFGAFKGKKLFGKGYAEGGALFEEGLSEFEVVLTFLPMEGRVLLGIFQQRFLQGFHSLFQTLRSSLSLSKAKESAAQVGLRRGPSHGNARSRPLQKRQIEGFDSLFQALDSPFPLSKA